MPGGYDSQRLLRILVISSLLFVGFILLQPYGLGWVVVPVGLGVAAIFALLSVWRSRRTRQRIEDIKREIDAQNE